MNAAQHGTSEPAAYLPMVEIDMDIEVFSSNWAHCDRISTYVARMVSHNRADSLLYSNLFSSALNELLETVFRSHSGEGSFVCAVRRCGEVDRIELCVPCGADQIGFYRDAMTIVKSADAADRYRQALFSSETLDPAIGLLELVVDYSAQLSIEPMDDDRIRLIADLALEETEQ